MILSKSDSQTRLGQLILVQENSEIRMASYVDQSAIPILKDHHCLP